MHGNDSLQPDIACSQSTSGGYPPRKLLVGLPERLSTNWATLHALAESGEVELHSHAGSQSYLPAPAVPLKVAVM